MAMLSSVSLAIKAGDFDEALSIARSSSSVPSPALVDLILKSQFRTVDCSKYTVQVIQDVLAPISDDTWVAITCASIIHDDPAVMDASIDLGLKRTQDIGTAATGHDYPSIAKEDSASAQQDLETYFSANPKQRELYQAWQTLKSFSARVATYRLLQKEGVHLGGAGMEMELELDDPWEENDVDGDVEMHSSEAAGAEATPGTNSAANALLLSSLLSRSLVALALDLAAGEHYESVDLLYHRHSSELWPYRYAIVEAFPAYAHPTDFEAIVPSVDPATEVEAAPTTSTVDTLSSIQGHPTSMHDLAETTDIQYTLLSASAVTDWYVNRITSIEALSGLVDVALAWVQHGVSKGVSGLDALGEELSLLSRLVYDAPPDPTGETEWSLQRWRAMDRISVVQAYLVHSTVDTVASDIRRLVLPYLHVESSKLERSGHPDPTLIRRILHEYILSSSLSISLAIFEASKATLPSGQRIITNDLDVARLALARLYGSQELDQWNVMSSIFECLPVWDVSSDRDLESDREATVTTLESLGAFVCPSTSRPTPPTPLELSLFFEPLPFASLSRALDILDVHLESGEVLARWNVPAPLRWFLQASFDKNEQRSWAVKMSRVAATRSTANIAKGRGLDKEWTQLMDDMIKLSGGGEGLLRGAFGLLEKEEILKIYLGGILSSGKFDLAKSLLRTPAIRAQLSPPVVEGVALAVSRELYENAQSGNMHAGEMAMAWECLSICPPSPRIKKEQDLIEATSRISSFHLRSTSSGEILMPIEIRQTVNKLDLIKLVISSGQAEREWYKHPEVLLELAAKLGPQGEGSEVKVLGMLADDAVVSEDWESAATLVERMVPLTMTVRQRGIRSGISEQEREEISEATWRACFQLGRQTEWPDLKRKMTLLGRGMELCPKERVGELLSAWRKLEEGQTRMEEARKYRAGGVSVDDNSTKRHRRQGSGGSTSSVAEGRGQTAEQLLGSRRAARAAKTLNTIAADLSSNFATNLRPLAVGLVRPSSSASQRSGMGHQRNLSGGGIGGSMTSGEHSPARSDQGARLKESLSDLGGDAVEMRQQARRALVKGVGWLIGAGDEEMGAA